MRTDESDLQRARARIDRLCDHFATTDGARPTLIETHSAWVILTDEFAYKFKKPLKLPFLDFSTLDARCFYGHEEVRLNRRLVPDIYLAVIGVLDGPDGPVLVDPLPAGEQRPASDALSDGDALPFVDFAVKMRRFEKGALWSERLSAGRLTERNIDTMAHRIASFHRHVAIAAPETSFATRAAIERTLDGLIAGIDGWQQSLGNDPSAPAVPFSQDWSALREWLIRQLTELDENWSARRRGGYVRECHGDLHLRNAIQLGDEATAFDGIEFDADLRWIDVANDIAFLAMDLLAWHRADLAWRFVNAWLEESGDYESLPVLRFYLVCRALVRAHVGAIASAQGSKSRAGPSASEYLDLAIDLSRSAQRSVALMHGLPGVGKTYISQAILAAAGAVRVRSDVERKRLFGLAANESSAERVPEGIYGTDATTRTYSRLEDIVRAAMGGGWPVIVDAAFLRRDERTRFMQLAESLGAKCVVFDCRAPASVLRSRIEQRQAAGGDASEADLAVLEKLSNSAQALDEMELSRTIVVDATLPIDADGLVGQWLHRESGRAPDCPTC